MTSLLILDNALDHGIYYPAEHWERWLNFSPEVVHVAGGRSLPEPGRHSHVIISGSESSVTTLLPWAEAEVIWVKQAARRGVKILGSCWGHQLIARALGGPRCVRVAVRPEFGWQRVISAGDDPLLPAPEFHAFTSHFDEVVPLSHPDLRVLAWSDHCAVHALRWGSLPVWGIQSHPEMDPAAGQQFLSAAIQRWPEHRALLGRAATEEPCASDVAGAILSRFLCSGDAGG